MWNRLESYLGAFRGVVFATNVGFNVGLLGPWQNALLLEGYNLTAHLYFF
jgi:hypothetical protein